MDRFHKFQVLLLSKQRYYREGILEIQNRVDVKIFSCWYYSRTPLKWAAMVTQESGLN